MFLELWFKFCCSQRQKNEEQDQPPPIQQAPEKGENLQDSTSTYNRNQSQRMKMTGSDELKQKIIITKSDNSTQKKEVKTSLEMEVEQVDGYLCLNDTKSQKIASWELLEQQRQAEAISQLNSFAKLTNSHSSYNNGSNENFQSGQLSGVYFQNGLADTMQLHTIHEKQMIKSQSFNIKDKKINKKKKKEVQPKLWEQSEDDILRKGYYEHKGNWREITKQLPGRNMNQCVQRWRRLNPAMNNTRKKWTFDDDIKIKQLVDEIGKNWSEIAKHFPEKNGKQIRERYLNKLDPEINFTPWTQEEDEVVLNVYKIHGPQWSMAARQLKGRPENMVKNRFYSYIRRVVLGQKNPYQVVLNNNEALNDMSSESQRAPFSIDQSPTFTGSSLISSLMDDNFMENEIMEDQFKI